MEKIINKGHTNKLKYIEDKKFIIEKTYNGFNHKIRYEELSSIPFAPKLIENTKEKVVFECIDGESMINFNNADLEEIGKNLRTLHKSDLKLPNFNIRRRVQDYLKILKDKMIKVDQIDRNYDEMFKLMARMKHINPCHNDLWPQNIMKDKNQKIYFVDWEYATMGDKHFDLVYFIESARLSQEQEKIFLNAYNSQDDYRAYIEEWMPQYKKFVNWFIVLWAHTLDEMPFDISAILKKL